jgi:hypothetical protein
MNTKAGMLEPGNVQANNLTNSQPFGQQIFKSGIEYSFWPAHTSPLIIVPGTRTEPASCCRGTEEDKPARDLIYASIWKFASLEPLSFTSCSQASKPAQLPAAGCITVYLLEQQLMVARVRMA